MKYLVVLLLAILAFSSNVNAASNLECELCGFVVSYVEGYVSNNASEATIIQEAEKICTFVPGDLQSTCDTLVQSYLPEIISFLSNKVSSSVICQKIGMCSNKTATKTVGGAVECSLCEFLVSTIEKYLSGNATETQIIQFLDNDCKIFGGLANTCQSLVNQWAPTIIAKLLNNEPPATVCQQIKLCTSSSFANKSKKDKESQVLCLLKQLAKEEDAISCTVCEFIFKEVETFVEQNQTESEIIAAVAQECNILVVPTFVQICQSIVDQYAPQIIQYVLNQETPQSACTLLGLCGGSSESGSGSYSESSGSQSSASGSSFSGSSFSGSSFSGTGSSSGGFKILIQ
ncbi:saposin B domain-containing protein [Tieghemostelium lacteum]|uniref:Saposin B domain-containing protein n=1 Tax=Tieghemostelium lacteum TaxID=361077 RepID=A0A151Z708_TIELA|nr:saposin B domain-containing protein [Tieghemostelium lacteum]|eukprot:KYQ89751.1 saposin B domain-containing protein [Tieghemostelium lacteum]